MEGVDVEIVRCTDVPYGSVRLVWPVPGRKWLALADRNVSYDTEKS